MANRSVNHREEQEKRHRTNPWQYPIHIGFFAGLFFGFLRWICYQMNFTVVLPGFLVDSFFRQSFLKTGWGNVVGIAFFILFSIVMALLYKVLLGKFQGPWPGIFYGLAWWIIVFVGVGPMIGITGWMNQIGWNTIFTEVCVFTLWGLFIGYSIAFEFTDEASREPMGAKS